MNFEILPASEHLSYFPSRCLKIFWFEIHFELLPLYKKRGVPDATLPAVFHYLSKLTSGSKPLLRSD